MNNFVIISGLIGVISWYFKIRFHLKYFYKEPGNSFPGLYSSMIELPFYKIPMVFLPIPIFGSKASYNDAKPVIITSLIALTSFALCFGVGLTYGNSG